MYRIAIVGLAALSLAGCALNSSVLTSGFAGNPTSTASISPSSSDTGGVKLARLNDKAPTGTFEKAPSGSLTGRDYSKTRLNIEMARDIINQYRKDNGLKPLVISAELTAAAKSHSRDRAKWDRISHYGSD